MEETEIKDMVLELLDNVELNDWEYDFINDLADKESFWLTNTQEEKLKDIYDKYIG